MRMIVWLRLATVVACGVLLALATPVAAQTATALVREEQELPGAPGQVVDSIGNSAVNHVGGYAFGVVTVGTGTLSTGWGNATGGAGTVLRTEGIFGDYDQTSWESFYGMANSGALSYSPLCTYIPSGTTSLDSVWLEDTFIAMEETAYPHAAGYYWSFGSRPGVTADGVPYFVGGITTTPGGSTQNRGLFYGMSATPLLMGGDTLPNLPYVLDTSSTVSFDYRFSALGTNYMGEVQMDTTSTVDNAMVMNGSGLMLGGGLVREGSTMPEAIGGLPGENWDNFDYLSITESGSYLMTGDSDAASGVDEFVIVNGQVVMREGDMLGDYTLSGSIEGGYMNEDGDWAVVWDVNEPGRANIEVLIVNGDIVLKEGDAVDWDGDGLPDADAIVTDFTGLSALTVGDRGMRGEDFFDIYTTIDVDIDGRVFEGGFRLSIPEPATFSLLLLGGLALLRRR
ncbi:MAG: PEP-CTERM sorting domain-containing protein [Phycisphaerae bacterium]|jgi:hypothetical protein